MAADDRRFWPFCRFSALSRILRDLSTPLPRTIINGPIGELVGAEGCMTARIRDPEPEEHCAHCTNHCPHISYPFSGELDASYCGAGSARTDQVVGTAAWLWRSRKTSYVPRITWQPGTSASSIAVLTTRAYVLFFWQLHHLALLLVFHLSISPLVPSETRAMEEIHTKMKNEQVMEIYGWNTHQQKRFRDAVFKEGRKLLYEDEYWKEEQKPEPFDLSGVSNSVLMDIIRNLRAQLSRDDLERKREFSPELVKWKLQQWITAEKKRNQRTSTAPTSRT